MNKCLPLALRCVQSRLAPCAKCCFGRQYQHFQVFMCCRRLNKAGYAAVQLQKQRLLVCQQKLLYASRPFRLRGAKLTSTRAERAKWRHVAVQQSSAIFSVPISSDHALAFPRQRVKCKEQQVKRQSSIGFVGKKAVRSIPFGRYSR